MFPLMPRRIRDSRLETRAGRLRLRVSKKPVFMSIGRGLSVGYRRNRTAGTWVFRQSDGKGGFQTKAIGSADDFDEANGEDILDFWQAQEKIKSLAQPDGVRKISPLKVSEAFDRYIPKLRAKNARTAKDTEGRVKKHFLPKFGSYRVIDLTQTEIGNWHASLTKSSDDDEVVRRSKDSANRVLSMVKAFLNDAWQDKKNHIPNNDAWRNVKPFKNVSRPREVRYSPRQARLLIKGCTDKRFADLVRGSYLTGARYGELNGAKIFDFDVAAKTLRVSGKTGSRDIILQSSAVDFFKRITKDRPRDAFIFVKADGERWKRSEQTRPMKAAIKKAKLDDRGSLYALRHAYISEAIERNTPLTILAKNCGTSVRIIEKTYAKVLRAKEQEFVERGAPSLRRRRSKAQILSGAPKINELSKSPEDAPGRYL
jgi:integrase